jgi:WASH complex subunit 7
MDASLQGKEMMHKKNITRGGYYTDDGFAIGLAFILSVTDQQKMYDRLNWFKSIQSKYTADEEDLVAKKTAEEVKRDAKIAAAKQSSWFSSGVDDSQEESDELKNLKMMEKRIEGNKREMAMLFFSMNEATALFKGALT